VADSFKLIILPATKAGMTRTELQHYLEYDHGPLVMKHLDVSGGFTEYVHHYVENASGLRAGCDAVTIISFASAADLGASKASQNYRLHVEPDEDNFRDEAESRAYSGTPNIIRDGPRDTPHKLLIFRKLRNGADAPVAWESHVAEVLGRGQPDVARVVVNRLSPLGGQHDFDILDEIGLSSTANSAAIEAVLAAAPGGLLAGPGVALVTRPKIFVYPGDHP
jgi:EthD domain